MSRVTALRDELTMGLRRRLPERAPSPVLTVTAVAAVAGLIATTVSLSAFPIPGAVPVGLAAPPSGQSTRSQRPTPPSDWSPPALPATFSCATPVRVVLDPDGGGAALHGDVRAAITAVSQASRRPIVDAGISPGATSAPHQAQTIVVSVVPDNSFFPGSDTANALAVGGDSYSDGVIHDGYVEIAANTMPPRGDVAGGVRPLLAHELMHALGVDVHSTSPNDLMYPSLSPRQRLIFGAGDLRALAAVGCP